VSETTKPAEGAPAEAGALPPSGNGVGQESTPPPAPGESQESTPVTPPSPPDPAKRKAAQAEAQGEPHVIEWEGMTFSLPALLPVSVAFDLAGTGGPFADIRCLASLLGPEQTAVLRARLDADQVMLDPAGTEYLGGLVEKALAAYGLDTGESPASP
jgi:hypothetical protein